MRVGHGLGLELLFLFLRHSQFIFFLYFRVKTGTMQNIYFLLFFWLSVFLVEKLLYDAYLVINIISEEPVLPAFIIRWINLDQPFMQQPHMHSKELPQAQRWFCEIWDQMKVTTERLLLTTPFLNMDAT